MNCIPKEYAELVRQIREMIAGTGPIPAWLGESASTLEKSFNEYKNLLNAGLIPIEKRADAAADAFQKSFKELAERSQFWSDKVTNGSLPSEYAKKISGDYAARANDLLDNKISAEKKLADLSKSVNSKLDKLLPGLSSKIGTVFDAGEVIQSLAKGDTAAAFSTLSKMLAADAVGTILATLTASAFGVSSAGAIALAAGIYALATSILGKEFGIWDGIGRLLAPLGNALGNLLQDALSSAMCGVSDSTNNRFGDAITFAPRDPLALDLDNDGIEVIGINPSSPILFDHNGDGAPSATGWLKGDDGWLVRDLDGDGKITSGKELLGVDTDITVGGVTRKATSGFEALRALDTHQDGDGKNLFDSRDAAFSQLRVWQDKNQNGVTDTGKLSTLAALGIVNIQLQESATSVDLGGGNSITGKAKVTRRIGASTSTSELDSVLVTNDAAANLNLAATAQAFAAATTRDAFGSNSVSLAPRRRGVFSDDFAIV